MDGRSTPDLRQSGVAYCFGPFRLEPDTGRLFRGEQPVSLTRKTFAALLYLCQHRGLLVTKEDLMQALWPDAFVSESNLTQTIFMLRKALGDNGTAPGCIATVSGRGYRFTPEVQQVPASPPTADDKLTIQDNFAVMPPEAPFRIEPSESTRNRQTWTMLAGIAGSMLLVVSLVAAGRIGRADKGGVAAESQIRSVAVLPLKSLSGDPAQAYFPEGVTDELIARLAEVPGLRVISHTSSQRYRDTSKSIAEIASELHVDAIIKGTVICVGDRVRISAQLVRSSDGRYLWAESYERDLRDVLYVQDEIARDIAWNIDLKLNPAAQMRLASRRRVAPEALDIYLRGRHHWRSRRPADLHNAIGEFQQAILLQPDFALAYAGLAECYVILPLLSPADAAELYPKAKTAAEEALSLDPSLAEVHTAVAYARMYQGWDFAGAEQEFQRALAIDPNYSTAHQWYAELLSLEGRHQQAIEEIRKTEQLDPFSAIVFHEAGQIYRQARQYEQAVAEYRKSLDLDPHMEVSYYWMSNAYLHMGKAHQAAAELRAVLRWKTAEQSSPDLKRISALEAAYSREGLRGWTATEIRQLPDTAHRPAYFLALSYAALGKDDKSFEYLSRAYAAHDSELLALNIDPEWDRLRSDPRFATLSKKIGLPQSQP